MLRIEPKHGVFLDPSICLDVDRDLEDFGVVPSEVDTLKCLLGNLLLTLSRNRERSDGDEWLPLIYSRREQSYRGYRQLGFDHFTMTKTLSVVDKMVALGFLNDQRGYFSEEIARRSRLRPRGGKLVLWLARSMKGRLSLSSFPMLTPVLIRVDDVIVVPKGRLRERVLKLGTRTARINESNARHVVELPSTSNTEVFSAKSLIYRVFCDRSLAGGGRFYGHFAQQLSAAERKTLLLDGDPVVELDFGGMHPRLLYARAGVELATDPYLLAQGISREDHKVVFQRLLNCVSRRQAIQNVAKELPDLAWGGSASDLVSKVEEAHAPVENFFFVGEGLRLQRLDSDIAEAVMLDFVELGEPIIPVHDSFIVRADVEDKLRASMARAYEENVGVTPTIKRTA